MLIKKNNIHYFQNDVVKITRGWYDKTVINHITSGGDNEMKKRGFFNLILNTLLAFFMCFTIIGLEPTNTVKAEGTYPASDPITYDGYEDIFQANNNKNSGRIWTDKSVGETLEYSNGIASIRDGEDFLVAFSALSSTTTYVSEEASPLDVIFVLDFSASMSWSTDDVGQDGKENSRMYALVESLNSAIDTLVKANLYNRIGIVTFNRIGRTNMELTTASNILEIVHDGRYLELTDFVVDQESDILQTTGLHKEAESTVHNYMNNTDMRTDSKTNIQFGINQALQMFEDVKQNDTKVNINGKEYQRIPSLVIMSDGAPTTISLTDGNKNKQYDWWEELDRYNEDNEEDSVGWGDNDQAWSANGILPMLTAAYLKETISAKYYGEGSNEKMSIYTIGFAVNHQTDEMVELANLVLNPKDNYDAVTNSQFNEIKRIYNAFEYLKRNQNSYDVHYVTESSRESHNYDLELPNNVEIESLKYNDAYYPASNSEELNDAFAEITNSMTQSGGAPTETTGNPYNSGYITYTDVIGDYMEVKDVRSISIGGQSYDYKLEEGSDGIGSRSYVLEEPNATYTNNVYGEVDISGITVTVKTNQEGGRDILEIKIPAALIPLINYRVTIDGSGISQATQTMEPMRIIYSVGLKEEVLTFDKEVDTNVVSADYISSHRDENGNILFYSNYYDGTNTSIDNKTAGNAYVEYEPAPNNPFYFIQEDTPIYIDQACTTPVTNSNIDTAGTYYFENQYYQDGSLQEEIAQRAADQFAEGSLVVDTEGNYYIQEGSAKLGNLADFTISKGDYNNTNTSETSLAPTFVFDEGSQDPGDGVFHVFQGNNGVVAHPLPSYEIDIPLTKEISGLENWDGDYQFSLAFNGTPGDVTIPVNSRLIQINSNTSEYTKSFEDIKFKEAGEYAFTVTETIYDGDLEHGTVSTPDSGNEIKFKVVVEEENGTFSHTIYQDGSVVPSETLIFTNTYTPDPTSAKIEFSKMLDGRNFLNTDEFTFTLTATSDAAKSLLDNNASTTATISGANTTNINTASGSFNFENIDESYVGQYITFELSEDKGSIGDITYDSNKHVISIIVEKIDDALTTTVQYPEDTVPQFTNIYEVEPLTIDAALNGTKSVTGDAYTLNAEEFEFTVDLTSNNADGIQNGFTEKTVKNDADGNIVFFNANELVFTKPGEYVFEIKEVTPSEGDKISGITYDNATYTVTYTVTDNNDGTLSYARSIEKDNVIADAITFTNEYNPDAVSVTINGTKTLSGKELAAGQFNFMIFDADGNQVPDVSATNDADDSFTFNLSFDEQGEYTYTVKEVNDSQTGVTYDTSEYPVIITVSEDPETHELVANVTYPSGDITFNNSYKPLPLTLENDITFNKTLSGRGLNEGEFTFEMKDGEGNVIKTVNNDADGHVVFSDITFEEAGTHEYTVNEVKDASSNNGITYDDTVYSIKFEVVDNDGQLELVGQPVITINAVKVEGTPTFANTYKAQAVEVTLEAEKLLLNRDLKADEFTFELCDAEGTLESTATNNAEGNISFEALEIDTVGTYNFTIKEVKGSDEDIDFDDAVYEVTIEVTDNLQGQLVAEVTYSCADKPQLTEALFTNVYTKEEDPKDPDPKPEGGDTPPSKEETPYKVVNTAVK